jgi:hypothetical protein
MGVSYTALLGEVGEGLGKLDCRWIWGLEDLNGGTSNGE